MPRLNRHGEIAHGLGLCWLDDTRQIRQQQIDGTWKICVDGVPVDPRGCNFLAAGGGFWLASTPGVGVFNASSSLPAAGLPAGLDGRGAASFDGAIAISNDASSNHGLTLIAANGEVTAEAPDARLTDKICVVSRTKALWIDQAGEPQTIGLPVPQMLPGQRLWPRVLFLNGTWWICYHADDAIGVVLHPFDSLTGYRITLPPAFYLDAVAIGATVARVAWAVEAADERIESRDVDVTRGDRVPLRVPDSGTTVPNPGTPTKTTPDPEPVPVSIPNQLAVIQRVRAKYPTPLGASHGAFLIEAAQQTGGKLLRKEAGTNVLLPSGVRVSQDILVFGGEGIDILSDGEGAAIPAWQEKGPIPGEYIDVGGVVPQPDQPQEPKPAPSVDLSAVLARLDLMEKRSLAAQADTVASILRLAESIEKFKMPAPAAIVFPEYESQRLSLIGTITLRPKK